jgi:hypothetical protein
LLFLAETRARETGVFKSRSPSWRLTCPTSRRSGRAPVQHATAACAYLCGDRGLGAENMAD